MNDMDGTRLNKDEQKRFLDRMAQKIAEEPKVKNLGEILRSEFGEWSIDDFHLAIVQNGEKTLPAEIRYVFPALGRGLYSLKYNERLEIAAGSFKELWAEAMNDIEFMYSRWGLLLVQCLYETDVLTKCQACEMRREIQNFLAGNNLRKIIAGFEK